MIRRASLEPRTGSRFDEALYMSDKARLTAMLARALRVDALRQERGVLVAAANHRSKTQVPARAHVDAAFGTVGDALDESSS